MLKIISYLRKKYHAVVAIFTAVVLTGCAGQVNMLKTLSEKTSLQPTQGIVVARIVNASAYPLPFNQLTITPENLNASKEIKPERLQGTYPNIDSSTVFASPVSAGNYALSSIRSFHSRGDIWYSRFVNADARFGTFEVKAGQVTDLGTIIYYPKSQDDKYVDTLLRLPESELGEVLNKYFPFYTFDKQNILSWNEDDYNDERESIFASTAQNPITFSSRYLAPDKSLYFLGKLGVIVKRTNEGEWEIDAVNTNFDLTSIAQNEQGDIVVGGGEGKVFWKTAGGDWQDISLEKNYKVEKIFFDNENIDILARKKTQLSIFRGQTTQQAITWQELNSYTSTTGWKNFITSEQDSAKKSKKTNKNIKPRPPRKISGVTVSTLADTKHLTIYTYSTLNQTPIFASKDSHVFSYNKDDWSIMALGQEPEISTIVQAGAITLGIKKASFWSFDGKPTYLKYQKNSNQWEKISTHVLRCQGTITQSESCQTAERTTKSKKESFNFRTIPWFKNEQEAIAAVSFSKLNVWTGKRSVDTSILSTEDGGKTWVKTDHELPKPYCNSFIPDITDRLLVSCNGASGDFYESLDDGATWQHVRQQENF